MKSNESEIAQISVLLERSHVLFKNKILNSKNPNLHFSNILCFITLIRKKLWKIRCHEDNRQTKARTEHFDFFLTIIKNKVSSDIMHIYYINIHVYTSNTNAITALIIIGYLIWRGYYIHG